jgi:hypothetical protein
MAARKCAICGIRNVGTGREGTHGHGERDQARVMGYCNPCLAEAEWENTHSDHGHDDPDAVANGYATQDELDACWMCHPELNLATSTPAAGTGHTNTVAKSRTSHREHYHPRTPEARSVCRKLTRAGKAPLDTRKK